jgi:hypothetical protein
MFVFYYKNIPIFNNVILSQYPIINKMRILIVEDEVITAMNMEICVKISLYQIHIVYNIHSITLDQIIFKVHREVPSIFSGAVAGSVVRVAFLRPLVGLPDDSHRSSIGFRLAKTP